MPDTAERRQVKSILQRSGKFTLMVFDHRQKQNSSIHQQLKELTMDVRYTHPRLLTICPVRSCLLMEAGWADRFAIKIRINRKYQT